MNSAGPSRTCSRRTIRYQRREQTMSVQHGNPAEAQTHADAPGRGGDGLEYSAHGGGKRPGIGGVRGVPAVAVPGSEQGGPQRRENSGGDAGAEIVGERAQ